MGRRTRCDLDPEEVDPEREDREPDPDETDFGFHSKVDAGEDEGG